MRKLLAILGLLAGLAVPSFAQTAASPVSTWTVTANAVALPGSGNTTLAGTLAGVHLAVTPNFSLEQTDFMTSSAQTNAFLGGATYNIAALSKALNNISPNLNGLQFSFSIHGDIGEARIAQPSGSTSVSVAGLVGGEVDYAIAGSKMFSLGVRVDDFYVRSGLPHGNNLVVALGPSIHF